MRPSPQSFPTGRHRSRTPSRPTSTTPHGSSSASIALHAALLRHQPGLESETGRFRTQQVWIGPGGAGPCTAEFVAPHHERIAAAITDLVRFTTRKDLSVVVQAAVVNTRYLTDALGLAEMTALRALATLTDRGILTESTGQGRNRVWRHREILDVLDRYAETVRRTGRP